MSEATPPRTLFRSLWRVKRYWLWPLVASLVFLLLMLGLSNQSSVAPFIYNVF
jgi:hypothetical protein